MIWMIIADPSPVGIDPLAARCLLVHLFHEKKITLINVRVYISLSRSSSNICSRCIHALKIGRLKQVWYITWRMYPVLIYIEATKRRYVRMSFSLSHLSLDSLWILFFARANIHRTIQRETPSSPIMKWRLSIRTPGHPVPRVRSEPARHISTSVPALSRNRLRRLISAETDEHKPQHATFRYCSMT